MGLWNEKRWAEYLTVVVTASLIPFEIYEMVHHLTPIKIGALALNAAILVYLVWVLRREESE